MSVYNVHMGQRTNRNVVYRTSYHVVWVTKYRRDLLTPEVGARLREIAEDVCTERSADLIEFGHEDDHVHLLVDVDPQYGIHRLIKNIKGRSSRLIRLEFPPCRSRVPTLWTNSYFVATTGGAPLDVVKEYVAAQPLAP
jgi:putative transposase